MRDLLSNKFIECPGCKARASSEPADEVPEQLLRRCTHCGHVFLVDPETTPFYDERRLDLARRARSARCERCRALGVKVEMLQDGLVYFCDEKCQAEAGQSNRP